jgi:hypothetical protein
MAITHLYRRALRAPRCIRGTAAVQAVRAGYQRLQDLLLLNVRAARIALEATVAEVDIVRAPYKLNAARERRGKPPLPDYDIINLANRKRYVPVPEDLHDKRHSPRLHFRSHIRHYANYTVKIIWCLVGDPDLEFIDKDYKL